jgi:hypothetical protein
MTSILELLAYCILELFAWRLAESREVDGKPVEGLSGRPPYPRMIAWTILFTRKMSRT